MIVDATILFNELDILDIRLEELYPVIDRFVIVESNITFRGNPKPYYFEENKSRYDKYLDKVVYVTLEDNNVYSKDSTKSPWEREKWQRNQVVRGYDSLPGDTLIIIADVDEIPRREAIKNISIKDTARLTMDMFYYALNVYDGTWGGAKIARKDCIKTPEQLRHSDPDQDIQDAGWHFSYLGDEKKIIEKIKAFSHWELDVPEVTDVEKIKDRMLRGEDIWGRGKKYAIKEIDDTYPHAIKNNIEKYKKYIHD